MLKYNDLVYHKVFKILYRVITPQVSTNKTTIVLKSLGKQDVGRLNALITNLVPLKLPDGRVAKFKDREIQYA